MKQININEVNLSKITKLLEDNKEDKVIVNKNGKPLLEIKLFKENNREKFFGYAKGLFEVPEDFDDIDISKDFKVNN